MKTLLPINETEVNEAYQAFLRFNKDEELRRLADERLIAELDFNTSILYAKREGLTEGKAEAKAESILLTLTKRFKTVPKPLEEQVLAITDLARLEKLADFAFDCETLGEFGEVVK